MSLHLKAVPQPKPAFGSRGHLILEFADGGSLQARAQGRVQYPLFPQFEPPRALTVANSSSKFPGLRPLPRIREGGDYARAIFPPSFKTALGGAAQVGSSVF